MYGEKTSESEPQPPKIGTARELYELGLDEDVDVDELLAEARDGGSDE